MINGKKIGLGVVTCDRVDYFAKSTWSIIDNFRDLDYVVFVNDGQPLKSTEFLVKGFPKRDLIQHTPPYQNVATSKNDIIRNCLNNECDYIFIMEDDMVIQSPDVFNAYITAMEESGIQHMNFAHHGRANYIGKELNVRLTATYENSSVDFFPNLVGSFSVYTNTCLKSIGLMDNKYNNAMEHVDHTYIACRNGFHPPFWWFADITNSLDYVKEIEGSINNSTRVGDRSHDEIETIRYFETKQGLHVSKIPNVTRDECVNFLKKIKPK